MNSVECCTSYALLILMDRWILTVDSLPIRGPDPMFAWHYLTLYHMAINKASLIMVEGDQLLDATIVTSMAIFSM